ncbi:MAG: Holliday junction DNA helicase RuvA [Phycisphaera sp.]|nr:Holliday junction DNA helicase RuvA [Phycisphaera sp.]
MISRIHGILESVDDGVALITPDGGLSYDVLVPAFVAARLGPSIGQAVTLHTVHYLEGTSQGTTFTPRLAGFVNAADREFYELFRTVKGIGPRKALRAMTLNPSQIAAAIADRDAKTLQSLPEIGKRMAETIVASLHGKVDAFVSAAAYGRSTAGGDGDASPAAPARGVAREALEVLLQLGENRAVAIRLIDDVLVKSPEIDDAQELIAEVLRAKAL